MQLKTRAALALSLALAGALYITRLKLPSQDGAQPASISAITPPPTASPVVGPDDLPAGHRSPTATRLGDLPASEGHDGARGEDDHTSNAASPSPIWMDQFEEKYAEYSPNDIEQARLQLSQVYETAARAYGSTFLESGQYIELDHPNMPEPHQIPQSVVPGEGMISMAFSIPQANGSFKYRWVFFQPSSLPEEAGKLGLERNFLAVRAQQMGMMPEGAR